MAERKSLKALVAKVAELEADNAEYVLAITDQEQRLAKVREQADGALCVGNACLSVMKALALTLDFPDDMVISPAVELDSGMFGTIASFIAGADQELLRVGDLLRVKTGEQGRNE